MKLCENNLLQQEVACYENMLSGYPDILRYMGFSVLQIRLDPQQLEMPEIPEPNPFSEDGNIVTLMRKSPGIYSLGLFEEQADIKTRLSYTTWYSGYTETVAKDVQGNTSSLRPEESSRIASVHVGLARAIFHSPYPEARLEKIQSIRLDILDKLEDPKITISTRKKLKESLKETIIK